MHSEGWLLQELRVGRGGGPAFDHSLSDIIERALWVLGHRMDSMGKMIRTRKNSVIKHWTTSQTETSLSLMYEAPKSLMFHNLIHFHRSLQANNNNICCIHLKMKCNAMQYRYITRAGNYKLKEKKWKWKWEKRNETELKIKTKEMKRNYI